MEDGFNKRQQIPAFGNWDFCDELPITQYFESAMQAGLIRGRYFYEDVDHLMVPEPVKPTYQSHSHNSHRHHRKPREREGGGVKQQVKEQPRKQIKVCSVTAHSGPKKLRAPKAVDEDLYKIPTELLYKKPRRKRLLKGFWSRCLGLPCIP